MSSSSGDAKLDQAILDWLKWDKVSLIIFVPFDVQQSLKWLSG